MQAAAQPTAQVNTLPMTAAGQSAAQAASQPAAQSASPAASAGAQVPHQAGTPAAAQSVVSPVPLTGGQISVRQGGQNVDGRGSAASGIPPLTATDVYGRQ